MTEWSPGVFWEKYYSFWGKVVDLKYIDAALDWRDEGTFVGRPAYYEFELGRYHRFETRRIVQNPGQGQTGEDNRNSTIAECEAALQGFADAAESWGESIFSGVDFSAAFLTRPDPTALQPDLERLRNTAAVIESRGNNGDIGDLRVYLSDWDGSSYESFMVFHQRLTDAGKFQAQYINALANYLDVAGGVVKSGQFALIDGIIALEAAADEQLRKREADVRNESSDLNYLALASMVAGGAGLIPGPQQAILGAASFGFSVLDAAIPDAAKEEVKVEVTKAEELGERFTELFTSTVSTAESCFESIQTGTSTIEGLIDDNWDIMIPPRPDITDAIDPNEFHHESSPHYDG